MDTVKPWNVLMFYVDDNQGFIEEFYIDRHEVLNVPQGPAIQEPAHTFIRCRVLLVYVQDGKLVVDPPFVSSFIDPKHYVQNLLQSRITGILVKDEYEYLEPFMEACQGMIHHFSQGLLSS